MRALATGVLHRGRVGQALWRELRVASGMGLFLGAIVFAVAYLWTDGSAVASCAGLAMFAAVLLSAVIGAVIPLSFRATGRGAAALDRLGPGPGGLPGFHACAYLQAGTA